MRHSTGGEVVDSTPMQLDAGPAQAQAQAQRPCDRFDIALAAALIAGVAFCTWRRSDVYPDDALIVLRYAHQLLAGNGWVYNVGEAVNATTSPLYVMLVTAIGACTGDLLLAQSIAFALPLSVCAVLAYVLLRQHGRVPATMAGLLATAWPCVYTTLGMESTLLAACALAACAASQARRHGLSGLLAGAAALARPDAGLLCLLLGLRAWRASARSARRFAGAVALVVAPWLTFAVLHFGSVAPNTLAIKLAQRRLFTDPPIFLNGAWRELRAIDEKAIGFAPGPLLALFALAFVVLAVRARGHVALALFALFTAAQFTAYAVADLPPYHWYYAPALLAAALAVATLFGAAWSSGRPLWMGAGLGLACALFATAMPDLIAPTSTRAHYRQLGEWFAANTPPDCSLSVADIGIVGYFALPRRIIDMQGLATAGGAAAIARGDTGWWFDLHRPDYVLVHTGAWQDFERPVLDRADFHRDYRRIDAAGLKGFDVFERRAASPALSR